MSYSWPLLPDTTRALDRAEAGVSDLLRGLPKPRLEGPEGEEWFQFAKADQSWKVVAVLKLVRTVSGLRAAKRLGESGFTHEMAILFRTIDDFLDEVTFLSEPFFTLEELHQDRRRQKRVGKAKIRAAQGRLLDQDNPDGPRRSALAIDSVWDSYVHGGYPTVMELYGEQRGFYMDGMAGTIRVEQYRRHLALYTYRILAVVAAVAYALKDIRTGDRLRENAHTYARSGEYPDDSPEVTGLPGKST